MSQANSLGFAVRKMGPDDLPFVASGWKRSHHNAPQHAREEPASYFGRMNRQVDDLLARRGVTVYVAVDSERPDVLAGFVCVEPRGRVMALHYAYTRRCHRRLAVCGMLLRHALRQAPAVEVLVYTAASRFDDVWERWGFQRASLREWNRGDVT